MNQGEYVFHDQQAPVPLRVKHKAKGKMFAPANFGEYDWTFDFTPPHKVTQH